MEVAGDVVPLNFHAWRGGGLSEERERKREREREKETPGVKKNRVGRDAAGKQNGETA